MILGLAFTLAFSQASSSTATAQELERIEQRLVATWKAIDRYVWLRLWGFLKKRQGPRGRLSPVAFAEWERRSGLAYFYLTGRRGSALHVVGSTLSESRMREYLTYGLMWQGVETSTSVPGATP